MINFDLKDRVAIVTGGAQGFGLAITERFIASGASVVIWDIDEEAIKIATLKARRQIAEFINVELKSDNFTSSVSDSLQASQTSDGEDKSKFRNTIALKVRENITQKSSQILKGTIVQSEKHDAKKDQVIVTVVTGIVPINTSKQLKQLMSQ